ncbi:MAG: hypothetical protein LBR15_07445 [Methanobrevibacter sp.]|nr:hypothetical protein [Candidatus Methanovirga australis]
MIQIFCWIEGVTKHKGSAGMPLILLGCLGLMILFGMILLVLGFGQLDMA